MITHIIKRHFRELGFKLSVKTVPQRHFKAGHLYLEWMAGGPVDRLESLISLHFSDYDSNMFGIFRVDPVDFKPEGHQGMGVCKKCGCSQNDACEDPDTGTCYWVLEDLCSACASPEQKAMAMEEMRQLFNKEEAQS